MLKYTVPDMTCGHCSAAVTKAVKDVDTGADITIDLSSKTVSIETTADPHRIKDAMGAAGYPVTQHELGQRPRG